MRLGKPQPTSKPQNLRHFVCVFDVFLMFLMFYCGCLIVFSSLFKGKRDLERKMFLCSQSQEKIDNVQIVHLVNQNWQPVGSVFMFDILSKMKKKTFFFVCSFLNKGALYTYLEKPGGFIPGKTASFSQPAESPVRIRRIASSTVTPAAKTFNHLKGKKIRKIFFVFFWRFS